MLLHPTKTTTSRQDDEEAVLRNYFIVSADIGAAQSSCTGDDFELEPDDDEQKVQQQRRRRRQENGDNNDDDDDDDDEDEEIVDESRRCLTAVDGGVPLISNCDTGIANNRRRRCRSAYLSFTSFIVPNRPAMLLFVYLFTVLTLIAFVLFYAFVAVMTSFPDGGERQPPQPSATTAAVGGSDDIIESAPVDGCDDIEVEDVWIAGLPKLMTESAIRLLDVNDDGVLDVLIGFATGAEGYNVPDVVCDIYFSGSRPCLGGLLALDGSTGNQLWRHYTEHEVFAVNCNADLDADGLDDCLAAGRVGTFEAVSSRDGHRLWRFSDNASYGGGPDVMNFYTGQFIDDVDGDRIPDVVAVHGGDPFAPPGSATRLSGKLLVVSGRDGRVVQQATVPDGQESYYSPVIYRRKDESRVVLFGTGGETHAGSLWVVELKDLLAGKIDRSVAVYSNRHKGVMTPPVLIDLTGDGVVDIVFATYNSSVLALDGQTFSVLWNYTYPMSETYATPAPGYYNDDDVPDFLVHMQYGPGFPVYYHSMTTVLDGRNGRPLLDREVRSSVGAQSSPLTISVEGLGNDIFIYWNADCSNHEGEGGQYDFVKGTSVYEKSRSDFCRLRFKTDGFSRLFALQSHSTAPGKILYDSQLRHSVEHQRSVDTADEARRFLARHPELGDDYQRWLQRQHQHGNPTDTTDSTATYDSDDLTSPTKSDHFTKARLNEPGSVTDDVINGLSEKRADARRQMKMEPHHRAIAAAAADYQDAGRRRNSGMRPKRHVGPHDEGGVQRLISTGTLAPPLLNKHSPDFNGSMDFIFATYWFYPAKTKALLPADQLCIYEKLSHQTDRYDPASEYFGMDIKLYEDRMTEKCIEMSGHQLPEHGTYQSLKSYTPYTIKMGQMTVYRMRIRCSCRRGASSVASRCNRILPFDEQQWAGYMGSHADSLWTPRTPRR